MSVVPNRETFQASYRGKPPWDIGRPQRTIVEAADQVTGAVLDAGCGTGEHALLFAGRGQKALGFDFLESPIEEARRKAAERKHNAEFLCMDALALTSFDQTFDSVIDSGLFHVFSDQDRTRYVEGLAHVTRPGGRIFLLCFSEQEPGTQGPRRVTQQEIRDAFSQGWSVERIREERFEIVPDLKDVTFSEGGPRAWFAVIRREG